MLVACLCPVYRRPILTKNALACFLRQVTQYDTKLIIVDDGGSFLPQETDRYVVITRQSRFPDLGSKYNYIGYLAVEKYKADYLVVWEDDDIYLPWHIECSVNSMRAKNAEWSIPSWVHFAMREGLGKIDHRMHGSLAFSKTVWARIKWPTNKQISYDSQFMGGVASRFGDPADPLELFEIPSYVFRFETTRNYHGQAYCGNRPDDTTWYDVVGAIAEPTGIHDLEPQLDAETQRILEQFAHINPLECCRYGDHISGETDSERSDSRESSAEHPTDS